MPRKEMVADGSRTAKWLAVAVVLIWSGVVAFGVLFWREWSKPRGLSLSEKADLVLNAPGPLLANDGSEPTAKGDAHGMQIDRAWPAAEKEGWVVIPTLLIEHSLGDWNLTHQPTWAPDVLKGLGLKEEDIESLDAVVARQYRALMERMAARAIVVSASDTGVVMELPPLDGEAKSFFAAVVEDAATLMEPEKAAGVHEMLKLAESMLGEGSQQRLTLTSDGTTVTIAREQLVAVDPDDPDGRQWRLTDQRGFHEGDSKELGDWLNPFRSVIESIAGPKPAFLSHERP
ncbi:MAG: hypothetical protein ACKV19_20470 [Verrucomicrobiales bacterium]